MKEPLTVNLALFTHNEIQPDILLKYISSLFSLALCQW